MIAADEQELLLKEFEQELEKLLSGEIDAAEFKHTSAQFGVYQERTDGQYMVRSRIPAGALPTFQAKAIAKAVAQYGALLHPTTRQNIQIHGVAPENTIKVMRMFVEAGLVCKGGGGDTVRNVAACPYASECAAAPFDVTPYALAISDYLLGLPGSTGLPRKYKIALSGCTDDCALAGVNDLGLIAEVREDEPGFKALIGGGMGAKSRQADVLIDWLPAHDCLRVAEAVRRIFERHGNRENRRKARLRFAVERLGFDAIKAEFEEEMAKLQDVPQPKLGLTIHDAEGEASPRTRARKEGLIISNERDPDMRTVEIPLPLGVLSSEDLLAICELSEEYSDSALLRLTRDQSILIPQVIDDDLDVLTEKLKSRCPDLVPAWSAMPLTACAGASTCRLGICDSRKTTEAAAKAIDELGLADDVLNAIDIRVSGCPNACGQHPVGSIGCSGLKMKVDGESVEGFKVLIRPGKGLAEEIGKVSAERLPDLLVAFVRDFEANGEAAFDMFAQAKGIDHFRKLAESIPTFVN